jgi:hypothetical protein
MGRKNDSAVDRLQTPINPTDNNDRRQVEIALETVRD